MATTGIYRAQEAKQPPAKSEAHEAWRKAMFGEPVMVDAKGRATWATSRLKVGTHRITASYVPGAESEFLPSTSLEMLQPSNGALARQTMTANNRLDA